MGYYVIRYLNDEISIEFCKTLEDAQSVYGIDEKTLLLEAEKEQPISRIIEIADFQQLLDEKKIGFIAEKYFRDFCAAENIIAIRVEQSKSSYEQQYKKVFSEYVKRPDYYILKNDVFVEVKAKSEDACNGYFFSISKRTLKAYKTFQEYTNKKLYFAVYRIDENRIVLQNSLAMIELDAINSENENVVEEDKYFLVLREAFSDGLELLLN